MQNRPKPALKKTIKHKDIHTQVQTDMNTTEKTQQIKMQYEVSMTLSERESTNEWLNGSLVGIFASMEQMKRKISELEKELKDSKKCKKICRKNSHQESEDDCSFTDMGMNTSILEALEKMNEFVNVDDSNQGDLDEVTRQLEFVLNRCKWEKGEDETFFGDGSTGSTFLPNSFDDDSEVEIFFDGDSLCLDEDHGCDEKTEYELCQFPTQVETLCTRVDGSFLERLKDTMGYHLMNEFDKEGISKMNLGEKDIFVDMIEALDILMAERSTFLDELIALYELM